MAVILITSAMSSPTDNTGDDSIEINWRIDNFDLYPHFGEHVIRSPLIALGNPSHSALFLEVFQFEKSSEVVLAYRIKFLNKCPVPGFECEVTVKDEGGAREIVPSLSFIGLPLSKKFLPHGVLNLQCLIKFNDTYDPVRFRGYTRELSHKIGSLYDSKEFSDLTLHTNDKEFFVHKFLIRNRAPKLFEDLGLHHEIIENGCIKVENISTPALQNLLQYLYSGTLNPVSEESLPETYELFKKYQLKEFENEIIKFKFRQHFCSKIKITCKYIHLKIDIKQTLNEGNLFSTQIHIDHARFLIIVRFFPDEQGIRILPSIRCISPQDDEFVMSFFTIFILNKNTVTRSEIDRIRFSKSNWKEEFKFKERRWVGDITIQKRVNLYMQIRMSNGENSTVCVTSHMFPETPSIIGMHLLKDDLSESLNGLCDGKETGDVAIDYGGGKLMAHKAVLAAWSPVFRSMFSHDMFEKRNNQVTIPDVDYFTVFHLLTFMYSGSGLLYPDLDRDMKLYVVADKYQVTHLFEQCSSFLAMRLVDDNVCDILVLADLHSDERLFAAAQRYIATRRTTILGSKEWLSVVDTNPRLISKVLRDMPVLAPSEIEVITVE